ncbi:MAG: type III-A CRISPR-associated protein Csm2 [Nitrospirae bacterium]|nr:type III-A CRISPR-associated protein Csm2 [Nitrospirota bacterium]
MGDFKQGLEKIGMKGSGVNMKTCKCGKPIKGDYSMCYECNQKSHSAPHGGGASSSVMPKDYLKDGYFDKDGCIHDTLLTTTSDEIAKSFSNSYPKLEKHQLRRFFNHARAAENKLNMTHDWPDVNVDIKKLLPFVAEAKGKGKIPEAFYEFIRKNIEIVRNEKSFSKGFIEHFQAVVAYYTYHNPKG